MFFMKFMFAFCYISVNVMAIVTVFRFNDVSRATISAFGSSTASSSRMILPVVDALNLQVDNHRSTRQQQLQRPDLSLSMRTVAEGGLFQVQSQGTDIFKKNDDATTRTVSKPVDDQKLVEDLQQQHEQMKKMIQMIQPQEKQQETHTIIPSIAKAIGKTSLSSTTRRTRTRSGGRISTILKGIRFSSANDPNLHQMQPKKNAIIEGMPRLSSAMVNYGDKKLGPISYKMIVQDLCEQDRQMQKTMEQRMTIQGGTPLRLSSSKSKISPGPISPCWKQKHHLISI